MPQRPDIRHPRVDDDEVGELAHLERSDAVVDAHDLGAAERVQAQHELGHHRQRILRACPLHVDAHAHVLPRVAHVGARLIVEPDTHLHPHLEHLGHERDARREATVGCRLPRHRGATGNRLGDDLGGRLDEMAEHEPEAERPGIPIQRELGLLVLDRLGRFEEVRLVRHAVPAHRLDLELGGLGMRRPLHLAHDRRAEGIVGVHRSGVRDLGGEAVEDLVGAADRDIHTRGIHETDARIERPVGLPVVVLDSADARGARALAVDHRLPRLQRVGEVVRRRDAVGQEVERPVQRRPVQLLGRHVRGRAEHRVAPAVERVGDAEAAQAAREQVRMARDEAGRDEGARDVEGLVGRGIRRPRPDRGDAAVFDQHPAVFDVPGVGGAGGDRDETRVGDEERHARHGIRAMFPRCHGLETRRHAPETREF